MVNGGHHGRNDAALDFCGLDLIDFQNCFDRNGKLQRCGVLIGRNPFYK